MLRIARIKSPAYIYHVMCRSISEVSLFRDDDDKNYYLDILKKYKEQKMDMGTYLKWQQSC